MISLHLRRPWRWALCGAAAWWLAWPLAQAAGPSATVAAAPPTAEADALPATTPPDGVPALAPSAVPSDDATPWAPPPALPRADDPAAEALPLERGLASWYGPGFHRRRTASGEFFDMHGFTAAHRTLPFGTLLCVRSLVTGRAVAVRVNDRGPHLADRVIDLSQAAARELGLTGLGIKPVAFWRMDEGDACEDRTPEQVEPLAETVAPPPAPARRARPAPPRRPVARRR